jgi:hypothetical protein
MRSTHWLVLGGLLLGGPAAAADVPRPIVVELFTSQGCSSCPPADEVLGELSRRSDVLPLAFHVDYWDRLGWKDPFSSAAATARQRSYASWLSAPTIYTPQMVIDGRTDVVGSYRDRVLAAIDKARAVSVVVPLTLSVRDDAIDVRIGGAEAKPAKLWLVGFDRHHVTKIGAGENGGRTLSEFNVVRGVEPLGDWSGAPLDVTVPAAKWSGYERIAVVLQETGGHVIGAAIAR